MTAIYKPILGSTKQTFVLIFRWDADMHQYSALAEKFKCNLDTEFINQLDQMYK